MKFKLLFILLLILNYSRSQDVIYHYQKLKAGEGKMKKGQKEGPWKFWSPLGYPLKTENYSNGKLTGKAVYYKTDNADLTVSAREEMIKNKEVYEFRLKRQKAFIENEGDWNLLLKNNFFRIEKIIHYTDNKIDTVNIYSNNKFKEQVLYPYLDTSIYVVRTFRPFSYRDSVNQTIEEITYKSGIKNGPFKKYNTKYKNEIMSSGFYLDGKKDSIWLWEKDNVKEITRYRAGTHHGLTETYRFSSCTDSALYLNGKKEGLCKTSKKDYGSKNKDTLLTYSQYSQGKLNGTQTIYKKGKTMEVANYKDGLKEGVQVIFFDNGNMKKEGFFKNNKRDSTLRNWDEKNNLRSFVLYRNEEIVKEDYYYDDGKPKTHFQKTGENSIEIKYYSDGKKRKQIEKSPTKEIVTNWDDNGKKEVKIKDIKKRYEDFPPEETITNVGTKDYSGDQDRDPDYKDYKTKYERRPPKSDKKDIEWCKAYFIGGENEQKEFLNLLTKNDKRESSPEAFYVQAAITVSETGEIIYVKASEIKKVKKKYLKEAERIVLLMPKWKPAVRADQPSIENTGFNIWFSEKK